MWGRKLVPIVPTAAVGEAGIRNTGLNALSSFLWQLPLLLLVPFKVSGWEVFSRVCFLFSFWLILLRGGVMAEYNDVGEFLSNMAGGVSVA